jgi:hypothetical protein
MKGFFGMKSKRQQRKQKHSTLIQEPQFKRSERNRSSTKHRLIKTAIKPDESILNLTTSSRYESNITELSHETKPPSFWKRIFKRNELPSK